MLKNLFRAAFTDPRSGPERLAASGWAKATTPDMLIVEHVLQSIVKNPDDWRMDRELPKAPPGHSFKSYSDIPYAIRISENHHLRGPDMILNFEFSVVGDKSPYIVDVDVKITRLGSLVELDKEASIKLTKRLMVLWEQIANAKLVALNAKRAMEANEAKWNIAESLLGMKRNEHGALVPVE